jgi:hypothetical protein
MLSVDWLEALASAKCSEAYRGAHPQCSFHSPSHLRSGLTSAQSIVAIIVESAALSTIWALFFVIAYATRSNLRFLIDVTPAIVSSANMLIYVRVGLGWAHVPAPTSSPVPIRLKAQKFSTTVAELHIRERTDGKQADLVWYVVRLPPL